MNHRGILIIGFFCSIMTLLASCSNSGSVAGARPVQGGSDRTIAPSSSNPRRAWYADRLEKLGFYVFPTPIDPGDFTAETLAGGTFTFSSTKGKVAVLNFWATWCPPCRAEMPSIQRLWDKMKNKDFTIVAVSIDDDIGTVRSYISAQKYTYPVFYDQTKQLSTSFNATSIPTTYLIDRQGMAIAGTKGSREYDDPALVQLLTEIASK
jgi:thiol-disulfide isomerase/thioredoxin